MPPEPHEYQGYAAIATFLHHRAPLLGGHLRLVATRANGQPAFGCYLPDAQTEIVRGYGLIVLAPEGSLVSAITWLSDRSLFATSGLHVPSASNLTLCALRDHQLQVVEIDR